MTYNEALQQINQFIVTNGNNEITADVLRPILEVMVDASRDTTGLLENLETEANENLVAAINELKAMIPEGATGTPVNFHFGEANPNTTPPASFKPGDNYWQSVGGNPVQLWIYNGFSWVQFGSGGSSFPEAPVDGKAYGRKDEDWTEVTNTPMNTAKVHYSDLGADSLEEVTPEMCDAWLEANYTEDDRLGFLLEVSDETEPFNFDVTANWSDISVIDQQSFENSSVLSGINLNISDFRIDGNNIKCTVTGSDIQFQMFMLGIAIRVDKLGNGIINVDLYQNQITHFTAALPESLTFLDLTDNQLTEFTPTLPESLTFLGLLGNQLTEFTTTLPESLTTLDLSDNQLAEFTQTLPESLRSLYLYNNQLAEFTQTLPESLIELYLDNNQLTEFTQTLPESLAGLFLFNNQLTEFTQTLPESLTNLDLSGNQLNELSINHILESYDAMPSIDSMYNISLDGGTNAAPTGAGLAAYNSLISKGANVTTN